MGRGSARAANWLDWGETLAEPRPGCVVVLEPLAPGASGHVGFWVKEERGKIHLLSGNQGERVNVTAFPKRKLRQNEYRWPPDAEGARRSGGAPAAVARGAIARAKGRRPGRAKSLPGLVPEGPSRD
jgi:hypothetical protein